MPPPRRPLDRLHGCCRGAGGLDRGPMRDVAIQGGGKLRLVVGVDLPVVPAARERDVRQAPIHKRFSGALQVDVHEDPVGRLSLAAVARDGVAVVQVGMSAEVEGDCSACIETEM
jgi:hypothetical protein